jgi:hypothetical protein
MDEPTKPISSHDPPSRRQDNWLAGRKWRCLPQGPVRAVAVVMIGILGQHRPQLPTSEDQHPVQHLSPNRAHPPLRVGIRPWRPDRRAQHPDPFRGEDRVERAGELGVPITQQEPEAVDVVCKLQEQVASLPLCVSLW